MDNEIDFSITDYEGVKVVKLSGNISNSTKVQIENFINGLTQKNNVILNMNEISVITSGGLSSLIRISSEARKRKKRVMIMGLREGLMKMMEVMGVMQYIIFVDSIEEGLSRV